MHAVDGQPALVRVASTKRGRRYGCGLPIERAQLGRRRRRLHHCHHAFERQSTRRAATRGTPAVPPSRLRLRLLAVPRGRRASHRPAPHHLRTVRRRSRRPRRGGRALRASRLTALANAGETRPRASIPRSSTSRRRGTRHRPRISRPSGNRPTRNGLSRKLRQSRGSPDSSPPVVAPSSSAFSSRSLTVPAGVDCLLGSASSEAGRGDSSLTVQLYPGQHENQPARAQSSSLPGPEVRSRSASSSTCPAQGCR